MIELSNISLTLNGNKILDDVCLKIESGEFFAILGPSGSGKTSLLNVIAGLLKQDSGSVIIDGLDITDIPPNKRNIGMVFQNFFVYPHLNVYENIRYPLRYSNIYKKEDIPSKIREVADLLKIPHLLKRKSFELSGGEKQRVALARAIIKSPSLFLLDEPFSNLDKKLRMEIRKEMKEMVKKLKKTFIYVTHDQSDVYDLADRTGYMNNGKFIQSYPIKDTGYCQ